MKKETLFSSVIVVLLSLFTLMVVTVIIDKQSLCLMVWLTFGLLLITTISYGIFDSIQQKQAKKYKKDKLDELLKKIKFPEDTLVDIETVTTEK